MRMKPLILFIIAISVIAAGFIAAIFFAHSNQNNASPTPPKQEQSVALNETICEAMKVYVTAPYHKYSKEELYKYFADEIANEISRNYEPFSDPAEETIIEFEEQRYPEIGSINIQHIDGEYVVKLRFGDVFYNHRLTITPNRIITKITDGGITFE